MKLYHLLSIFSLTLALTLSDISEKSKKAYQTYLVHLKHYAGLTYNHAKTISNKAGTHISKHSKNLMKHTQNHAKNMTEKVTSFVKRKLKGQKEAKNEDDKKMDIDAGLDEDLGDDKMFENDEMFKEFIEMLKKFGNQNKNGDAGGDEIFDNMENEDEIVLSEDGEKHEEGSPEEMEDEYKEDL